VFPLRDENPTTLVPFVTVAIIVVNVLVWLFIQDAGLGTGFVKSLCAYGAIPGEITGVIRDGTFVPLGTQYACRIGGGLGGASLLTSMFLHGGWMHLIGNMWFLWVFGNNIEDSMGHLRFIFFYLITGLAASGCHVLTAQASGIPTVGASGAISGVLGAYVVLYPNVRVQTLVFFVYIARVVALPALAVLGLWFALQLVQGLFADQAGAGVAFWAHIGGFLAGLALIRLFARPKLVAARRVRTRLQRDGLSPWE